METIWSRRRSRNHDDGSDELPRRLQWLKRPEGLDPASWMISSEMLVAIVETSTVISVQWTPMRMGLLHVGDGDVWD